MEDGDEGIVLSDLLRSGEASRLRRRGAIRDHRHPFPPPPSHDETQTQTRTTYRLFCRGGECSDSKSGSGSENRWSNEPFSPELFWSPTKEGLKKNGEEMGLSCGALVHSSASSTYTAHTAPSTTVVPLDAVYFDTDQEGGLGLGVSGCGCVKEGLGCSVCGTPLGTRYTPCKPSSTTPIYTFFPDAVYAYAEQQKRPQPELQPLRPPPRRSTRIGEDQVNTTLSILEAPPSPASSTTSSFFPTPLSPSPTEHEELEGPIIDDPELARALAMPWFGFGVGLSDESCDADTMDAIEPHDFIDDIEGYLERRIRGVLFECRGDEEDEDYDDDDSFSFLGEERERRLSTVSDSLQRTRTLPSTAPPMMRSYAQSRFR